MGYDITFHPVSRDFIQRYLFDVAEDSSTAERRARELATTEEEFTRIMENCYAELPQNLDEIARDEKVHPGWFARYCSWPVAVLASYRWPYWYARGSRISLLVEHSMTLRSLITPIGRCGRGRVSQLPDLTGAVITENYTASGFIEDLNALTNEIHRLHQPRPVSRWFGIKIEVLPSRLSEAFDDEGLEALECAIRYAWKNKLGLIEAADAFSPMAGYATKKDNVRAHFLNALGEDTPPQMRGDNAHTEANAPLSPPPLPPLKVEVTSAERVVHGEPQFDIRVSLPPGGSFTPLADGILDRMERWIGDRRERRGGIHLDVLVSKAEQRERLGELSAFGQSARFNRILERLNAFTTGLIFPGDEQGPEIAGIRGPNGAWVTMDMKPI